MAKSIPSSSFCWSPRDVNRAAHSSAKWCLRSKVTSYFDLYHCPPCFVNVIKEEAGSVVVVLFIYFIFFIFFIFWCVLVLE